MVLGFAHAHPNLRELANQTCLKRRIRIVDWLHVFVWLFLILVAVISSAEIYYLVRQTLSKFRNKEISKKLNSVHIYGIFLFFVFTVIFCFFAWLA